LVVSGMAGSAIDINGAYKIIQRSGEGENDIGAGG